MRARRGLLWLLAGTALALLGGRWLAGIYGDWAFHHALGADALWRSALLTRGAHTLALFAIVAGVAFVNLFAVRQSIVSLALPRRVGGVDFTEAVPPRRLTTLALAAAVLLGLLFSLVEQDWTVTRMAFAAGRFGEFDPYLDRDLAFYVHWLPFERAWNGILSVLTLVVVLLVAGLYAITPSVKWEPGGLYVSAWVRRHLGLLGGVAILLIAWDWRLDRFSLLTDGSATAALFETPRSFTSYDHRVLLPYLTVTSFAALPVAVVFAWAVWRGLLRVGFTLALGLFVAGPVMRLLLPAFVGGDRAPEVVVTRERPYRATLSLFTARAYGADLVVSPETAAVATLTPGDVARWVSAWDPAALTRAVAFERRGTGVKVLSWEGSPAGLGAALLRGAADDAPPGSRWPLDRLSASAVDLRGGPEPMPEAVGQGIANILIEPGGGRYALVADTTGRLAAPRFETSWQRLALAWDQQNPRLLAADAPVMRPRLVTQRDVRQRVARLAPFLTLGPTLTPLVRADSLYWAVELFAVAREYPLAERLLFADRRAHYVRHAATAIVQTQTGQVTLYPVDAPDPVMRTWVGLYPGLFTPRERAPAWLQAAFPPVLDQMLVQGTALGRTRWLSDTLGVRTLARVDDADADLAVGPATLLQVDSLGSLAWGMAVVNAGDEVTGLLVARGGREARTEFHPIDGSLRWTVVLERLQSAADSAGIGRVLPHSRRGRVQVIPMTDGVAFVQSFYDWPSDESPRLAGVVVLSEGRARVGRTIADALGIRGGSAPGAMPASLLRDQVAALYDSMNAALRAGDWRAYGEAWAALGRLLGRPPR